MFDLDLLDLDLLDLDLLALDLAKSLTEIESGVLDPNPIIHKSYSELVNLLSVAKKS